MLFFVFQSLYASIFLTCYNIFFSSLPVLFYGMFEKDVKDRILMENPHLYRYQPHLLISWSQWPSPGVGCTPVRISCFVCAFQRYIYAFPRNFDFHCRSRFWWVLTYYDGILLPAMAPVLVYPRWGRGKLIRCKEQKLAFLDIRKIFQETITGVNISVFNRYLSQLGDRWGRKFWYIRTKNISNIW